MNATEFLTSVAAGKIDRLYLFTGEEAYLHRECLAALQRALIPDESFLMLNFSEHSVAQESLGSVLTTANAFPMLADARLVLARDFDKVSEGEIELLKNYLRNPNPKAVVVFQTFALDKRRTVSTVLTKGCTVVDCQPLKDKDAIAWVQQYVRKQGYDIDPAAAGQVVGMVGTNLFRLSGELDKVAAYLGGHRRISPPDVEAMVVRSRRHDNFELSDTILSGDAKRSLRLLDRLLDQGAEPVMLVGMLARLFRQLLAASDLMRRNAPRDEVAREVGVPPFQVANLHNALRKWSDKDIRHAIARLAEIDKAVKSSSATPRLHLEIFLCEVMGRVK